ncbi:unnamed protein product [Enterobius vermicularis]|uniref:Transposase n=1 Tax=Enterobius vermicularis TaxID=51028 RepID=A0A0N4UZQ4_ENTVE|nr:unnamed protein product [Enterobius vermicularis]
MLVGQPATRTNSPFVVVNEYAALTSTQVISPLNCQLHDNPRKSPSLASVSELRVDAPPVSYAMITDTSRTVFPDTRRLEQLLAQYIPPKQRST